MGAPHRATLKLEPQPANTTSSIPINKFLISLALFVTNGIISA